MIKTLIELFDASQIENVIAGLRFSPQKIVFIGFKEVMTKRKTQALQDFFAMRGMDIQFEYETVGRYDFDGIVEKLNAIIDRNEDCCFDLTGGKELVLVAMGVVSPLRDIPMLQINVRTGDLIKVKNCDALAESPKSSVQIRENVALNGCAIIDDEKEDFAWDFTKEFQRDIEILWGICRRNCGLWNRQSKVFESFEKFGKIDENLCVHANLVYMKERKQDVLLENRTIEALIRNGMILDYSLEDDIVQFRYKNTQIHQCLTKAGNILELYAYMLLGEIADEDAGYYDDMDIGVYIDWDGVIHDGTTREKDTKNEVDIMLMRDLIPMFVSCKNGEVHKEALYELSTVADKFGGKYAKKFMITTYVSTDAKSTEYIKQRAIDMGIVIIDNVDKMRREELKAELKKRIK